MARTKRRLVKKRHRYWIEDVLELSWHGPFRRALMEAPRGAFLEIDAEHLALLSPLVAAVVRKWRLHYLATAVHCAELPLDESWITVPPKRSDTASPWVVFKFSARDFPSVCRFTGNNPET